MRLIRNRELSTFAAVAPAPSVAPHVSNIVKVSRGNVTRPRALDIQGAIRSIASPSSFLSGKDPPFKFSIRKEIDPVETPASSVVAIVRVNYSLFLRHGVMFGSVNYAGIAIVEPNHSFKISIILSASPISFS